MCIQASGRHLIMDGQQCVLALETDRRFSHIAGQVGKVHTPKMAAVYTSLQSQLLANSLHQAVSIKHVDSHNVKCIYIYIYTRTCQCGHLYTAANLPIKTKYRSPYIYMYT